MTAKIKRSTANVIISVEFLHTEEQPVEELVNEMDYKLHSGIHTAVVINNNCEIVDIDPKTVNEVVENQEQAQWAMELDPAPVQSFHLYLADLDNYENTKDWSAATRYDFFRDMQIRFKDGFDINTYQYNMPDFITEYLGECHACSENDFDHDLVICQECGKPTCENCLDGEVLNTCKGCAKNIDI